MFKRTLSRIGAVVMVLVMLIAVQPAAYACSSMTMTSAEGDNYWFRTCDMNDSYNVFGENGSYIAASYLVSYPAGQAIEFTTGAVTPEYTVIGMSFSDSLALLDGMNSAGLTGGLQMLNEGTSYPEDEAPEGCRLLASMEAVTWFLSQCGSVEDVIELANQTRVKALYVEGIAGSDLSATMHLTFTDNTGRAIVLEATDVDNPGVFTIYESIGVMTNSPSYAEHLENLEDYVANSPELRTQEITSIELNGQTITGESTGTDRIMSAANTSRDRFIRLSMWRWMADEGNQFSNEDMLALGSDVFSNINVSVDNNKGTYHYSTITDGVAVGQGPGYTMYTVCYDIARQTMYIRPYDTLTWTSLSIDEVSTESRETYDILRGVGSATVSAVTLAETETPVVETEEAAATEAPAAQTVAATANSSNTALVAVCVVLAVAVVVLLVLLAKKKKA